MANPSRNDRRDSDDVSPGEALRNDGAERAAAAGELDFRQLFEAAPVLCLVLSPELRIVAVSDAYLAATMTQREQIVGRLLFDVFPDNPEDAAASGTRNLGKSLERVLRDRVADTMAVQKYDIRRPEAEGGGFEVRYWSPINAPVLGANGEVAHIVHRVEDVTQFVSLSQQGEEHRERSAELHERAKQMEAELFQRAQELRLLNEELEARVQQRTQELAAANEALSAEIKERSGMQERFRLVVESAPHAMVMVDQNGAIVLVNRQTENFFGYQREELLGQPVEILVPKRFHQRHRADRSDFLSNPVTRPMGAGRELFGLRKNGSEFPVEIGLNLIPMAEGVFVLSAIVDITQRQQAERAQRHSELRFRAIFDQSFGFVGLLNTDGTILEVNQPALAFRNLALADVVGKPLWDAPWFDMSAQSRDEAQRAVLAAAQGEFVRREMIAIDEQGSRRVFDFSVKPVFNDAGNVELLIPEARDITDQKLLEEQFRKAQKMEAIGMLAGGVAHDFNNLLTIILGYSDVLQDSLRDGDPLREMVVEIQKAGARAVRLTHQLLAFSRRQVLMPVVINLNALLVELEKMLVRLIGEDVALTFRPAAELWPVRVDPGQIEQVVMNLVVNARDAMPRGGKLTIETANVLLDEDYAASHPEARAGAHVVLAVTDNGCGMDQAMQAEIFAPFFSTKGEKGTGLGLATVYGIVKQSGGHIAVYSEPQHGTSFKVYLPRGADADEVSDSSVSSQTRLHGTETVLLVEDEAGVRSLAKITLQRQGYHVLEASNGGEALLLCEKHAEPIHLLATDVIMPNMSGRELAERLLQLRPEMRVLYMSGYMDDAIVRHGLLHAGVPFLQKPYTPRSLANKVREVLDR